MIYSLHAARAAISSLACYYSLSSSGYVDAVQPERHGCVKCSRLQSCPVMVMLFPGTCARLMFDIQCSPPPLIGFMYINCACNKARSLQIG